MFQLRRRPPHEPVHRGGWALIKIKCVWFGCHGEYSAFQFLVNDRNYQIFFVLYKYRNIGSLVVLQIRNQIVVFLGYSAIFVIFVNSFEYALMLAKRFLTAWIVNEHILGSARTNQLQEPNHTHTSLSHVFLLAAIMAALGLFFYWIFIWGWWCSIAEQLYESSLSPLASPRHQ